MQEFNPIIHRARVARLATADSKAKPHIVPVVFAFDGEKYYIPIDKKTKTTKPGELRRIKNIDANPAVALLIDEYNEDWKKLLFIMVQGKAAILGKKKGNDEGGGGEVRRGFYRPGPRGEGGAGDLRADRALLGLWVQQEPQHRLRADCLSDGPV